MSTAELIVLWVIAAAIIIVMIVIGKKQQVKARKSEARTSPRLFSDQIPYGAIGEDIFVAGECDYSKTFTEEENNQILRVMKSAR